MGYMNKHYIPQNARDSYGRVKKGSKWKLARLCLVCGKDSVRTGRKYCSRKCFGISELGHISPMKGKKLSKETKAKLSKSHLGQKAWNKNKKCKQYSGEKHWNWQGGITKLNFALRECLEYKIWRRQVFERDNYTCQICNKRGNGEINADHIKPFSTILKEQNIKDIKTALSCKLLWDINNGRTLCRQCHEGTNSFPKNFCSKSSLSDSPNLQEMNCKN